MKQWMLTIVTEGGKEDFEIHELSRTFFVFRVVTNFYNSKQSMKLGEVNSLAAAQLLARQSISSCIKATMLTERGAQEAKRGRKATNKIAAN